MNESDLQVAVADYIRRRYPGVLFHSDFGSGIKLTKGQAIKQKRQNGGRRGWPDMLIAETSYIELDGDPCRLSGLFLELKKEGTRIYKKDGTPASPHIAEQIEVLKSLEEREYAARFAVGFDEAKKIIDWYLKGV